MRRNATVLIVVAAAVSLMLFTAYRAARRARNGDVAAAPGIPVAGAQAPDFALKTLDGQVVRLSDFRGNAVLLNFWATWCGPCKIEMPWFAELQNKYSSGGLKVIGVALDSEPDEVRKFMKEVGVNYIVVMGEDPVREAYGAVQGLPTTFYIDRSGKIVDHVLGLVGEPEIEANIKKAMASGPVHPVQAKNRD